VDPTFDERKFGFNSLNDLLRGCQKDGLFRMERDRQGVIRFFQGNVMKQDEAASASGISRADIEAAERLARQAEAELVAQEQREAAGMADSEVVEGDVVRETEAPAILDGEEAPVAQETVAAEDLSAEKPSRRKSAKGGKAPRPRAAKEPREKKSVAKPKAGRKKIAVAADA
jgi:hypothetical protein